MGSCNLPLLMTILVASVVGFAMIAEAQQTATCASNLVPCADYIGKPNPAATCCNSIKQAVATQLDCLCGLYSNPSFLKTFNITVQQALDLSKACGVTTDVSKCNAASPGAQPTAGGPPPSGAAGRAAWAGITLLFCVLASMMFY